MSLSDDLIAFALKEVTKNAIESDGLLPRVPSKQELGKYFRECGDEKFAKNGYDPTVEWCGIFAAYCLRNVGANVKWKLGWRIEDLSGGYDITRIEGNIGLKRGDIAIRGNENHHFIILDDEPPTNRAIKCVEGNSGGKVYPQLCAGRRPCNNKIEHVKAYLRLRL